MNTPQSTLATGLLAGLLAGGVAGALVASFASDRSVTSLPGGDGGSVVLSEAPQADGLLERLAALEGRVDGLEMTPVAAAAPERSRAESDVVAVEARFAKIEESLKTIATASAEPVRSLQEQYRALMDVGQVRTEPMTPEDARLKVLDPAAEDAEKLAAWGALRRAETWGDDVVDEMVRVAQTSTDAALRADVWRQADGRDRNVRLVGPMIDALRNDSASRVREEAAETLANYLEEPGVVSALQNAASNDPADDVREQARDSLGKRR